ncbi:MULTISPECIES: helix-turn-helix transcriptional regulator [unclassified Novosphingobium]|uniref:LuxR C-terminal-related transcriptional regulator n=1 Tax=Novosphingobium sp. SG919 TaxID=2587133 RepID=UPI00146EAA1C|nr:DNA-binding CsgD family transcriptional regulator [Novosphingobium sp. SG919]
MIHCEEGVARIIQSFAQTIVDPHHWRSAMELLSDRVGAVGCALELTDLNSGAAVMENTVQLDADQLGQYQDRIFHVNPRIIRALSMNLGQVADDRVLMSQRDYENSEFLDWLEGTPYYYIIGSKILNDNGHVGFLTANFAKNRGKATQDDHKIFSLLTPHLVNILAASRVLSANQLCNDTLTLSAMDAERPFAFLDRAGRLIECSQGFVQALRSQRFLDVRNSSLVARHGQHRAALDGFLNAALGPKRYIEPPLPLRLSKPDAPRGLVIRAVPLAPQNDPFDIFRPAALITLTDLDEPYQVKRRDLVAIFDLTVREADVAALIAEGHSPQQAAAHLRIGLDTVRQHLKAIYSKLNVSRQADLVSMIAKVS